MAEDPNPQDPPDWKAIAALLANGAVTEGAPGLLKAWQAAHIETHGAVRALDANLALDVIAFVAEKWRGTEEALEPIIGAIIAPIIGGLFGGAEGSADFTKRLTKGGGAGVAEKIVAGFMDAIVGNTSAPIEPTDAGSKRLATAAVQATLESEMNALLPEIASHFLPLDLGHLNDLLELPEGILRALGVSRLVRRAIGPAVTATCTTPMQWYVNQKYRPTLLGAATLAKLIARNPDQADKWREDLRRDGYSEERIDALLREERHYFSAADIRTFVYRSYWTKDQGLQELRDQGYDEQAAADAMRLEGLKRIDELEGQEAAAIISAYVAGDIDRADLTSMLSASQSIETERALLAELADVKRAANVQQLSLSQGAAMVKSGVLTFIDYRGIAERLNYASDAIDALDLQLRYEVDQKKAIEQHRKDMEAAKAKAAADREAARQLKLKEIAAQRALAARGPEAKLEDAAIRGLIPLARVEEIYSAKYDADAADILANDLASRRQDYVDRQKAADDAAKLAALKGLNVGSLEAAVYAGALTVDEMRQQLAALQLAPAAIDVLAATVAATLQARAQAKADRDAAAAAAKVKHIDLDRVETLVRRGHRTIADYASLLASLGYDAGSVAGMVELLQLHIDDDAKAAALRDAAAKKAATKALTLDQVRRSVILGIQPITTFTPWLLKNGYSTDDAQILVAELQRDVDEAAVATARRKEADRRVQAGRAPLSDVRRAARLGLIAPAVYFARLAADGYTPDDIAIESDLLTTEIAQVQALRVAADAADAAAPAKGLSLAQLQAAVLAGAATLADYTARALALGFSSADAQTLSDTLQEMVDTTAAARARKQELAAEGADRELKRGDLEKAVKQGLKTTDDYQAWLVANGYADDDAALLVAELRTTLGLDGAA